MSKKRVIIIGAGPAGLTAGYEILKRNRENYDVLILEQYDSVGGIAHYEYLDGNILDIGGHRFYSDNRKIIDWWNNFMPRAGKPAIDDKTYKNSLEFEHPGPDPDQKDDIMLMRKRVSHIFNDGKFYDYPFELNTATRNNLGFKEYSKALGSFIREKTHKSSERNMEDYYTHRFGKYVYENFFENYTEKLWGKHPAEIYNRWGDERVKGLNIFKRDKDNNDTSSEKYYWYPKYGPAQLWSNVAEAYESLGGKIVFNCTVTGIDVDKRSVDSVTCQLKGQNEPNTLYGDIVISTMPLKNLISSITGTVPPSDILRIANGLAYRDMQVVGLLAKRLKLSSRASSGKKLINDSWIYIQDPSVKLGRIQIYNNRSPYMVEDFKNTVWLGLEYFCQEGDNYWTMTDEEMEDYATGELISLGFIGHDDVIKTKRIKIKKAYPVYFGTYSQIERLTDYIDGFDNLYCIGRNGQHGYHNMDQAMETAFEAVDNILLDKKDKTSIWRVTADKSYFNDFASSGKRKKSSLYS